MPSITTETSINLSVLNDILVERERQDQKWGEQDHPHWVWRGILGEEMGELDKAVIELHFKDPNSYRGQMREELIQIVAVGIAGLENMERNAR